MAEKRPRINIFKPIESYPLRDKVVLVMKDMVRVEQALAMGAENDIHLMTAQKYNAKIPNIMIQF